MLSDAFSLVCACLAEGESMFSVGKSLPRILLVDDSIEQRLFCLLDSDVDFHTTPFERSVQSHWRDSTSERTLFRSVPAEEIELGYFL